MSILKFLLSPLLNEHGYTTLPTASIASGKPVTTGIFTNIKTALDSFNDGTGIANGAITGRTLYNAFSQCDEWGVRTAALYPPHWALAAGAATTSVVVSNRNAQQLGAGTLLLRNNMVRVAGAELIRLKFQVSFSGAGVPTGKLFGLYKPATGAWVYMGLTSGVANQVAIVSTTDAAAVTANQIAYTYANGTIYKFMIELDTTSARFYIDKVLIGTIAAVNNPSTTDLVPMILENAGAFNAQIYKTWCNLE